MSEVELTKEELRKVTAGPRGVKPKLETYKDVLEYNLYEIIKQKADVSYTQDILLPIAEKSVKAGNEDAQSIIKLAGEIKREPLLETEVLMETETLKGRDGSDVNMINIVLKIDSKDQAEKILEYIK